MGSFVEPLTCLVFVTFCCSFAVLASRCKQSALFIPCIVPFFSQFPTFGTKTFFGKFDCFLLANGFMEFTYTLKCNPFDVMMITKIFKEQETFSVSVH